MKCRHKKRMQIFAPVNPPMVQMLDGKYRFVTHWCPGCGCLRVSKNSFGGVGRWEGHIMNDFLGDMT